jgi:hypothetical protein
MTIVEDSLVDQISIDFSQACGELASARLRQRGKDNTANRAAVVDCRARIDVVLDLFLDTRHADRQRTRGFPSGFTKSRGIGTSSS